MEEELERLREQIVGEVDDFERLEHGMFVEFFVSNDNLAMFLDFIHKAQQSDSND